MSPISFRATTLLILAAGLLRCSASGTNPDTGENGGASGSESAAGGASASSGAGAGGASAFGGASGTANTAGGDTGSAGASAGASGDAGAPYLKAYSKAPYETSSSVFTLKVNGTSVDVVRYYNLYSYAHLAYEGPATFTVSLKSGTAITSFDISPHSYGLNAMATKNGPDLTFSRVQANSGICQRG